MNNDVNENNDDNYRLNDENITKSKYFEYKTKIIGNTPITNNVLDAEVAVP